MGESRLSVETSSNKHAIVRLFLLSLISLFVELLIIRWMAADIRAFSVFKTFPLVTFYVGLGLGLAGGSNKYEHLFPPAMLLFSVVMLLANFFHCGWLMFPSINSYNWQSLEPAALYPYLLIFMPLLVLLLSGPLLIALAIGSAIAPVFNSLKTLTAYSVNLGGALAGSILFAALSFAEAPPWALMLFAVVVMLAIIQISTKQRWLAAVVLGICVLLSFIPVKDFENSQVVWSPYQRLDLVPQEIKADPSGQHMVKGFMLTANHHPYQYALDLTPDLCSKWKIGFGLLGLQNRWMLPYQLRPADDVLIVASGMGSDVAQALWYGAKSIDAVDIDPVIIRLGKQLNPLKPYSDSRVNIVCDDARHYFSKCKKKYDLVVFSHLDSHTVVGVSSAVRLDNYIYTRESIRQALSLLKPNGIIVLSFWSGKDWFTHRLYNTIESAAGYPPMALSTRVHGHQDAEFFRNLVFILGQPVKDGTLKLPPEVSENFVPLPVNSNQERVLTDDWPYLYLGNNQLDLAYLLILAEIIGIALFFSRGILLKPAPAVHWQLFFMGSAFMLLELQLISRLALLFGSTWVTTSIVINGVLLMILFATALVIKFKHFFSNKLQALYVALLLSLLASYFLPMGDILRSMQDYQWLATLIICSITLAPVFAAASIFAISFDRVGDSARALAFNILGAVLGALFEYLSNYIGINSLLLVVMAFYALSFVFAMRSTSPVRSVDI